MFSAYHPIKGAVHGVPYLDLVDDFLDWISPVGSFHPGGTNVGFCHGSVRFVKELIQSTPYDTASGSVADFRLDPTSGTYAVVPGARLGVWQKLATRNGGEVLGAGEY